MLCRASFVVMAVTVYRYGTPSWIELPEVVSAQLRVTPARQGPGDVRPQHRMGSFDAPPVSAGTLFRRLHGLAGAAQRRELMSATVAVMLILDQRRGVIQRLLQVGLNIQASSAQRVFKSATPPVVAISAERLSSSARVWVFHAATLHTKGVSRPAGN